MRKLQFDPALHKYTLEGRHLKSNTQILKAAKLVDDKYYTDEGRDRGTRVHREVQREEEGDLCMDQVAEDIRPRVNAYLQFKKETGFLAELVEFPVWSDPFAFATTPDLIGRLNGRRAVIDVKTGAVDHWNGLQLAGQDMALGERIQARDSGIDLPWMNASPYPEERYILQLRADGRFRLYPFRDPSDRNAFLGASMITRWAEEAGTTPGSLIDRATGRYNLKAISDPAVRNGGEYLNFWLFSKGIKL